MANVKITDLTELAAVDLATNDVLPIVDIDNDATKKVTIASLTGLSDANDFVTYTQLNSNINVVSGNVDAVEANVVSIVDTGGHTVTFSGNVIPSADGVYDLGSASNKWKDLHLTGSSIKLGGITISALGNEGITITGTSGEQANVVTPQLGGAANVSANIATLEANVASTDTRLGANIALLTAADTAAETRLNANLDIVQDNVAAISVTLGIRGDGGTDDDVTVGTEELVFLGDTGITTTVSSNTVTIDLDDTAVTAGLYGGVSGGVTNVAAVTIDATGRITNAANISVVTNLDTLQDNINVLDGNADAIAADVTALEARRSANVTIMNDEDTALQARIAANTLVAASNDFVTYTQLNSNINVVQSNVANIIDGTTAFTGDVTLESDDGGSSAAPVIVLDRQSASPANADYLGRIQFKGKDDGGGNDTYGQISGKIIDVASGSEDGAIEFSLKKAGSSTIAARLRSDKLQLLNSTQLTVDGSSEFTGTVTMNDEVTMTDDLIITGNLTVNGDTTTINTTNMDVDDTMIMLANGTTGSPANDIGILFNRGAQGNAAFFYDESGKTFKLSDTKDPKSNTSLSPVTASNLSVGIVDAATLKYDGLSVHTSIADNASVASTASAAVEARRVANIAGAVSTVTTSDLTADRVMITNGSGKIAASSGVTPTELGYLDGLTLGTVAASKAVTADSNGDVNFIREVDIDGNVVIGTNASNTVTIVGILDCGAFS